MQLQNKNHHHLLGIKAQLIFHQVCIAQLEVHNQHLIIIQAIFQELLNSYCNNQSISYLTELSSVAASSLLKLSEKEMMNHEQESIKLKFLLANEF